MRYFFAKTLIVIYLIFGFSTLYSVASETNGVIDPDAHGTVGVNDNQYAIIYPSGEQINTGDYSNGSVSTVANVSVTDDELRGFFFGETAGWIVLNCADTDSGCSASNGNFKVANNDEGDLSGYAWGEQTGWVSFYCGNSGLLNCATNNNYRVTISDDGLFSGYAWSQNFGWIKFDCGAEESCTETDWRPLSVRGGSEGSGGGGGPTGEGDSESPSDTPVDTPDDETPDENPVDEEPTDEVPEETPDEVPDETPEETPAEEAETPSEAGEDSEGDESGGGGAEAIQEAFDNVVNVIEGGIEVFASIASEAQKQIENVLKSEEASTATKVVSTAGAVAGVGMTVANMVFLNPASLSELILIPFRLWSLLLAFLGLRKKPWGVVYDSVTKQPLDPVYVIVKNEAGEDVGTSITDLDGRYGFLLKSGKYTITAGKTNYTFPSVRLNGKTEDDMYKDLYFGETITLESDSSVIAKNIPMDPVGFDWNEFAKKQEQLFYFSTKKSHLFKRITHIMFGFGFAVATLALIGSPKTYNIIIFGMYVFIGLLQRVGVKSKALGMITDKTTGLPLSFAIIHIISKSTGVEIMKKVADQSGQYLCLVQNGTYTISVDKKIGPDEYQKGVFTSEVTVTKGYLASNLSI